MGIFYPYQKEVFEDSSQLKLTLKARQIGFSTEIACEGVMDSYETGVLSIFVSAGERQSIELARKSKQWCQAWLEVDCNLQTEKIKKDTITSLELDGGGRCMFFPSNPDTVRGFTGNVFLDEFAFHKQPEEIYKALFSTAVNNGHKFNIVSTPAGEVGKFYELWTGDNDYSKHKIDIYRAKREGYPIDIDFIKRNMDADSFAQEYECSFLAKSAVFIPRTMVNSCVSERCETLIDRPPAGSIYVGIDIGRKRDLTVIMVLEYLEDVGYHRERIELKNVSFDDQQEEIFRILDRYQGSVRSCCVDQNGIGMQIAETLEKKYPSIVEPITFTNESKKVMATDLKIDFENSNIRLPDDRVLINDITSVKKEVGSTGIIRYTAEHTEDGHADRFWSLALARHGRRGLGPAYGVTDIETVNPVDIYQSERESKWN